MTLFNAPIQATELYSVTTPDGVEYLFNGRDDHRVTSVPVPFMGTATIDWQTFTSYKSNQQTWIGYQLQPRTIEITFLVEANDRTDYWNKRNELINILRPNRSLNFGKEGQLTFTFMRFDGEQFAIQGVSESPKFNNTDVDSFTFEETVEITCFDPTWFKPDATSISGKTNVLQELKFPISFAIRFGVDDLFYEADITYDGTWQSYPVMTLTGSFQKATLKHIETGAIIQINYSISTGQTITVDVENTTVTLDDGTDLTSYLSPSSDFVGFRLYPFADKTNTIKVFYENYDASNSEFKIEYHERFIGI